MIVVRRTLPRWKRRKESVKDDKLSCCCSTSISPLSIAPPPLPACAGDATAPAQSHGPTGSGGLSHPGELASPSDGCNSVRIRTIYSSWGYTAIRALNFRPKHWREEEEMQHYCCCYTPTYPQFFPPQQPCSLQLPWRPWRRRRSCPGPPRLWPWLFAPGKPPDKWAQGEHMHWCGKGVCVEGAFV